MITREFSEWINVPKNYTGIAKIPHSGWSVHYNNGKFHREDGPAMEHKDGSKLWYLNGEFMHSIDNNESFMLYVDLLKLKGVL